MLLEQKYFSISRQYHWLVEAIACSPKLLGQSRPPTFYPAKATCSLVDKQRFGTGGSYLGLEY